MTSTKLSVSTALLVFAAACGGAATPTSTGTAQGGTASTTPAVAGGSGVAGSTAGTGSSVGTSNATGMLGGKAFAAQDAIYGEVTANSEAVVTVVLGDVNNLCAVMSQSGTPDAVNLVVIQLARLAGDEPVAGAYPVTDPNATTAPDSVAAAGGFSDVGFAASTATDATYSTTGTLQVTSANTTQLAPLAGTIDTTDATGDSVKGNFSAAYCAGLTALLKQ